MSRMYYFQQLILHQKFRQLGKEPLFKQGNTVCTTLVLNMALTHSYLETRKRVIGKQ